jgi:hypothetical protein
MPDRFNLSDMVDADRVALSRRRGGIPLRRRGEEPAEEPAPAGARAGREAEPRAVVTGAPDATEPVIPEADKPPTVDQLRPFAGLAEQVRAAGSGQVPAARTPAEPPAVPAMPKTPPAETA